VNELTTEDVIAALSKMDGCSRSSEIERPYVIPTGIISLDQKVLGGGIPCGRVIEIAGETGTGKTTFAQLIGARFQDDGGVVAWADTEGSYDPKWASLSGLDVNSVICHSTGTGEELLKWVKEVVVVIGQSGKPGLIVVDSVAGLVPGNVVERDNEHMKMNENLAQATMMGIFCREIISIFMVDNKKLGISGRFRLADFKVSILFINHLKAGAPAFVGGPPKNYTSGGAIKDFTAALRLWMYRVKADTELMPDGVGTKRIYVRFKTDKNRLAPPFAKCHLWLNHETASFEEDYLHVLKACEASGLVERKGAGWVTVLKGEHEGERFQGIIQFQKFCEDNPEFLKMVSSKSSGSRGEETEDW